MGREERWVEIVVPARIYAPWGLAVPTGPWFARAEAERMLRADGCDQPVRLIYSKPWVNGADTRTHVFGSARRTQKGRP